MSAGFTFSRMRFTVQADSQLRTLAARTQLRPNVICRIALAISLDLPQPPASLIESEWSSREINRGTLLGDIEIEFGSLLKQWREVFESAEDLDGLCLQHIHRGVETLLRQSAGVRGVFGLWERMNDATIDVLKSH